MTPPLGGEPRAIEPRDDLPHEHGGQAGWLERIAFNFFDARAGLGGIASLEYAPGTRTATGSLDLFLPDGGMATVLARAQNTRRADLTVGRIALECAEPVRVWRIRCRDVALVFPTAESASLAHTGERAGKAAQIDVDIGFEAWTEPAGWALRRTDVDEQHFASIVSSGFFEQAGRYDGRARVGALETEIGGAGFRERAWGVPEPGGFWYAVAFGPDLAVSMGDRRLSERVVTHGHLYRDGQRGVWMGAGHERVEERTLDILMEDVGGERVELRGEILATIPPRAGEPAVYRSMTRFGWGAREALGLVETRALVL